MALRPPSFAFSLGLTSALMLSTYAGFRCSNRLRRAEDRCWGMVPVVVANMELPAGVVVTWEKLSQRALPADYVTSSNVQVEMARELIGQVLRTPMTMGDPVRWGDVGPRDPGVPVPVSSAHQLQ